MDRQRNGIQGYRHIAPRQADIDDTPPGPLSPDDKKTKRASVACLECKKKRTKCSTGNPCSECAAHFRECVYDQSADKRRKEHAMTTRNQLQITQDNLSYYHKLLEDLLESIRYSDDNQLRQLFSAVRNSTRNPSPEEREGYDELTDIIDTVLGVSEDAEGSDTTSAMDGGMDYPILESREKMS
ncbi:putative C6 transcription factor SndA [Talaromyces proteolyticus]|uniref:C6 transcription factor SndA n=1 Tax=Talaromyces proteolyticus TaxID=1131652 RepID=A0AAD4Q5T4_9EURO|nr:putative C6 transcription factor SndA [Talaromyces proteolyticus]KAH8704893.1 putative C6 transcription factor SndA [Talaromyces proteolyticus]